MDNLIFTKGINRYIELCYPFSRTEDRFSPMENHSRGLKIRSHVLENVLESNFNPRELMKRVLIGVNKLCNSKDRITNP